LLESEGDEDYGKGAPGPDGFDDELFDVTATDSIVTYVPRDIDPYASNRFAHEIRAIITKMAPWPKTNRIRAVESSDRPMTVGYARIPSRISIDDIVGRSVSGIPAEVQSLFDNPPKSRKISRQYLSSLCWPIPIQSPGYVKSG
jgi:hypothetical protein